MVSTNLSYENFKIGKFPFVKLNEHYYESSTKPFTASLQHFMSPQNDGLIKFLKTLYCSLGATTLTRWPTNESLRKTGLLLSLHKIQSPIGQNYP